MKMGEDDGKMNAGVQEKIKLLTEQDKTLLGSIMDRIISDQQAAVCQQNGEDNQITIK